MCCDNESNSRSQHQKLRVSSMRILSDLNIICLHLEDREEALVEVVKVGPVVVVAEAVAAVEVRAKDLEVEYSN